MKMNENWNEINSGKCAGAKGNSSNGTYWHRGSFDNARYAIMEIYEILEIIKDHGDNEPKWTKMNENELKWTKNEPFRNY